MLKPSLIDWQLYTVQTSSRSTNTIRQSIHLSPPTEKPKRLTKQWRPIMGHALGIRQLQIKYLLAKALEKATFFVH